ncbi:1845_t:CDS:2, partial [Dentiscutata heterogama]
TTIETLEDIYPKIDYILKKNAIATQVRSIVLKIPIEKILPIMIAMLPTKGNKGAEQIAHLIRQVIEMSHIANLNILSFGADGYIFDIDCVSLPHKIIEKLRTWPTIEDLQECTRITFNEAVLLAKHLHIYNYEEESSIPEFTKCIEQIADIADSENDELNEFIDTFNNETSSSRSIIVRNAALEVARILPSSSDNDQFHEDETLNEDEIFNNEISDEDEDMIQQLSSFNKFFEIQYIVQHSPIPVSFYPFQQFFINGILDVKILLQICQNHDAFSPNMKSNFSHLHQITIDKNNDKINENVVNKLITKIISDNIDENQRKKRRDRILCLGKVITMYEKCGERHAWVEKLAGFLDNLSYISIKVYMQVTNRVFSCENLVGGNITIHITPRK